MLRASVQRFDVTDIVEMAASTRIAASLKLAQQHLDLTNCSSTVGQHSMHASPKKISKQIKMANANNIH